MTDLVSIIGPAIYTIGSVVILLVGMMSIWRKKP